MEVKAETSETARLHPELQKARAERVRAVAARIETWMRLAAVVYIRYGFYPHEISDVQSFSKMCIDDALALRTSDDQTEVYRLRRKTDIVIVDHDLDRGEPPAGASVPGIKYLPIVMIKLSTPEERKSSLNNDPAIIELWNEIFAVTLEEDYIAVGRTMTCLSRRLLNDQ